MPTIVPLSAIDPKQIERLLESKRKMTERLAQLKSKVRS